MDTEALVRRPFEIELSSRAQRQIGGARAWRRTCLVWFGSIWIRDGLANKAGVPYFHRSYTSVGSR